MDGLFTILFVIGIINAIFKWAKKQQGSGQPGGGAAPDQPWKRLLGDITQTLDSTLSGKPVVVKQLPQPIRLAPTAAPGQEGSSGSEGYGSGGAPMQRALYSASETAASPYSLSGGSQPKASEQGKIWHGSLPGTEGVVSFTAKLADTSPVEVSAEAVPDFQLRFDRDTLIHAVVMQEILTRPQDRRRRWSTH